MDAEKTAFINDLLKDYRELVKILEDENSALNPQKLVLGYFLYTPFTNASAVDIINEFLPKRPGSIREAMVVLRDKESIVDITKEVGGVRERIHRINFDKYEELRDGFRKTVLRKYKSERVHTLLVTLSKVKVADVLEYRKEVSKVLNLPISEQIKIDSN